MAFSRLISDLYQLVTIAEKETKIIKQPLKSGKLSVHTSVSLDACTSSWQSRCDLLYLLTVRCDQPSSRGLRPTTYISTNNATTAYMLFETRLARSTLHGGSQTATSPKRVLRFVRAMRALLQKVSCMIVGRNSNSKSPILSPHFREQLGTRVAGSTLQLLCRRIIKDSRTEMNSGLLTLVILFAH